MISSEPVVNAVRSALNRVPGVFVPACSRPGDARAWVQLMVEFNDLNDAYKFMNTLRKTGVAWWDIAWSPGAPSGVLYFNGAEAEAIASVIREAYSDV